MTEAVHSRSEIELIREHSWASVDGEREIGVRSCAAPVRDAEDNLVAAVNVSVNAARIDQDRLVSDVVPTLLSTAREISKDLGHRR